MVLKILCDVGLLRWLKRCLDRWLKRCYGEDKELVLQNWLELVRKNHRSGSEPSEVRVRTELLEYSYALLRQTASKHLSN